MSAERRAPSVRPSPARPPAAPPPSPPAVPRSHYWLPRTIWPTRAGWWFLGATLAIGLAATNTGNNLLYLILAMLLTLLIISGLLSEQSLRLVRVHRDVPRRLFAGTPASFGARVVNRKRRRPSYALHLTEEDPAGGPTHSHFFLKVPAQAQERWRYSLCFPARGRQRLPGLRLFTRFPFGLFAKLSRPLHPDPVMVYPAVRPLGPDEIPAVLDPGWRERPRRGHGAGLHNLRPYRPGDDPRLIHWKTSARTGDLVLKELEDEDRPRLTLVLEDPPPGAPAAAVEADLGYAASLAAHAIRQGAAVALATAEGVTGFGQGEAHLDRILERLALYQAPATPRFTPPPPDSAGGVAALRVRLGARAAGG